MLTESAKSITPALVLSKFLKMYEEMAREVEGDPWASVHAWAEEPSRRDWDINSGINFMQFVDCLGVSLQCFRRFYSGMRLFCGSLYNVRYPTCNSAVAFVSLTMLLVSLRTSYFHRNWAW